MIELSVIRDLVAIFGVIAGFSYYVLTVRNANTTKRKDILLQRINNLNTEWYKGYARNVLRDDWTTHLEYVKHVQDNLDDYGYVSSTLMLFQSIGSILKDGIIDSELVFNIYSPNMIIWTWEKFKPLVDMNRKMLNHPEYLGNFEYLYDLTCEKYPGVVHRKDYRKEITIYLSQSPTET